MYGLERVLHTGRRGHRPGLCRVSVPGLFVSALGFPGRLLHYQGLSFSSLDRESTAEGIFGCLEALSFYCVAVLLILRRND